MKSIFLKLIFLIGIGLIVGSSALGAHSDSAEKTLMISQTSISQTEQDQPILTSTQDIKSEYLVSCCRICTKGKACGNSCISAWKNCTKGPGCACNGHSNDQTQIWATLLLK